MLQGLVGPAFQPMVFILVSLVAQVRWNGGFLVYLVAFPIFVAMYLFLFEPAREQGRALQPAENPAGGAGPFPLGAAVVVGSLTLFASILYYVFIVNGSIVWRELGVVDPLEVSKATFIPSFFILAGSVLFRIVSRYSNAVQIGTFMALFGIGLGGIGLAHTVLQMQLALVVQQTGAGMAVPALIAWAQGRFAFEHRGRGMGVWTSMFFLGQAISPLIVGNVAAGVGTMQGAFLVSGLVGLAGAGLAALIAFGTRTRASGQTGAGARA